MPQMPGMSAMRSAAGAIGAVARRRADDLHERAGRDAGADRAVVRVEAAHRDRDACAAGRTSRAHSSRQPARGTAGRPRLVVEPVAQRPPASDRGARETPSAAARPTRRSTSPCGRPRRCSGRSARESSTPARTRRDEVGELDPARGGVEHVRRDVRGSARSSTTTTRTNTCRRSARDTPARAPPRSR